MCKLILSGVLSGLAVAAYLVGSFVAGGLALAVADQLDDEDDDDEDLDD